MCLKPDLCGNDEMAKAVALKAKGIAGSLCSLFERKLKPLPGKRVEKIM